MSFEREIESFTEAIWKNALSQEIQRVDRFFKPNGKDNTLAGSVHITGQWQGTISIHCPKTLAQKVAGIMFSKDSATASPEEVQDALGELANMTGGNIKSLLPEPCYLSLPAVVVTDFNVRVPNTEIVAMLNFECEGLPFMVTMVKKKEE